MPCYAFEGVRPVVDAAAFVHPDAVLIGDVRVAAGCLVGPHASLRGDIGRIELERDSNVQDGCVLHTFPGRACVVRERGHVGHGAVLHGCTVGRNALIGMQAVVMDDAIIGEEAFVAASALVPAGMEVPARTLAAGVPVKILRPLRDEEVAWKSEGTEVYCHLARRYLATLERVEPLRELPADRCGVPGIDYETRRARGLS